MTNVEWIPVSERLPEPYVMVITYDGYQHYDIAHYIGKTENGIPIWSGRDSVEFYGLTEAWMPLPEPYKGDGE